MNPLPHPTVELVVDGARSNGAYAVLDVCLPCGLVIPRHVRRGHSTVAQLLGGTIELQADDQPPAVVRDGLVTLGDGQPLAIRVLEPAHLVALLAPAEAASLIIAAAQPDVLADDRAALLAAAGITRLPALRSMTADRR